MSRARSHRSSCHCGPPCNREWEAKDVCESRQLWRKEKRRTYKTTCTVEARRHSTLRSSESRLQERVKAVTVLSYHRRFAFGVEMGAKTMKVMTHDVFDSILPAVKRRLDMRAGRPG